nr:G-protein coupled receptor Mth2-like isoform X2 [Penaeus vannamei]
MMGNPLHTLTTWAYRNGPVLLMLLVNLYFFVRLVVTLAWRFRDIDSGLQTARRSKDRYKLFIRLFIVMGLSWCLEFLTHSDTCAAWLVLCELVVELQGLWIFFVTVYSKNNRTLVLRSCSNSLARFGLARECENRQGITATGRNSNSTSENSKVRTSVLRMTGSAKSPDVPGMPSISRNVDIPIAKTLSDPTTSEVQENSDQTSAVTRISEAEKAARVKDTSEAE